MNKKIIFSLLIAIANIQYLAANTQQDSTRNYRPELHFTTNENCMVNPAATLYIDGVYHLFYEYSSLGKKAIFLGMAHATSTDLLHWNEHGTILEPDDNVRDLNKCTIRTGSAIIDENNVLGKQNGNQKTYIIFYNSYECGIRMAYSVDGAKTWMKYDNNPLIQYLEAENQRAPKVIWNDENKEFVMLIARRSSLTDESSEGISFYTSKNLKDWNFSSHIRGLEGRPDIFKLPVEGEEIDKWVLTDETGSYMIGEFNGKGFFVEVGALKNQAGEFNSPVTFVSSKDGKQTVVQIASIARKEISGIDYSGAMSIPMKLSLKRTEDGIKLFKEPIIKKIEKAKLAVVLKNKKVIPGINYNPINKLKGDCVRISGEYNINNTDAFGFLIRNNKKNEGTEILYNSKTNVLTCQGQKIPYKQRGNKIKLDILIDKSTIEIFVNDGEAVFSGQLTNYTQADQYLLSPQGGELIIERLTGYSLKTK